MKNTRFLILLPLIFFMASCEKEVEIETTDLGTEFFISDNGYTSLDTEVTFTIENQKSNLSTVKMTALGITDADDEAVEPPVASWDIALTSGAGSITIPSADLGMTAAGWSADFQYDGHGANTIQRFHSLSVSNPMTLTAPYIWVENDDGELELTPTTVYQNADVQFIDYEVDSINDATQSITIETKVGVNGDYTEVAGDFSYKSGTLEIVGDVYNVNDTVYYMFTAKNDDHEQVGELDFVINTAAFANEGGALLDVTPEQGFDLVANEIVVDTIADFEMVHVVLTSIGFQGFQTASNPEALFVAVDASVYDNNDIVEVKNLFANGTQVAGFDNVEMGDVFVYKTMRGEDEHYGIIKITKAYLTTSGDEDYLEFEYLY